MYKVSGGNMGQKTLLDELKDYWCNFTIYKKIQMLTSVLFIFIVLMGIINAGWMKISVINFQNILEENAKCSEVMEALDNEIDISEEYFRRTKNGTEKNLQKAINKTQLALNNLTFDYDTLGAKRYEKTWTLKNCYEVYCKVRTQAVMTPKGASELIEEQKQLHNMQKYLKKYARELATDTLEDGTRQYQRKIADLILVPIGIIISEVILLFGMIKLSQLLNRTLLSPIMKLIKAAKKIENNDFYIEDIVINNKDEMGELVNAFNKMKHATGEYIKELEEHRMTLELLHEEKLKQLEMEKLLKTTQLELLKSQINPHFLFNTLNVISGMADLEQAEVSGKMIRALSSLFRYNLRMQETEVLIAQELKVVQDYMYLQQMRFGERLQYEVICNVDQQRVLVPGFIFQPMVENAVIHGIAKKEEGGTVRIRLYGSENRIYIYIEDDGVGMSYEKVWEEKEKLESDIERSKGIGLGNIYQRVKAMYEYSRFDIFSQEGKGTVIQIVLPKKTI